MEQASLKVEITDGIALVTFNRPKALNALNSETLKELASVLASLGADESIRVLILTGAGKAFIAGADISEIRKLTPLGARRFAELGQQVIDRLQQLPIPVIAAVNGYALGGGCEMALASDFIYASDKAVFGLPEISLGIIPGFGGTQRLPRLIGANAARELIFTGRHLSAVEAREMGLVNRCFDPEALLPTAMETALLMAGKGRVALRAAKESIRQGLDADLRTGLALERDAFALCISSADAWEGTTAFLEKRAPSFSASRDA